MREPDKYAAFSVLVVDDNEHMRLLLRSMLRALGVGTVHSAAGAQEAIDCLRQYLPDILLVDWMMDGMNGAELAKYVRGTYDNASRHLPIIMVTGHGDEKTVVEAREAGVDHFLVKPVSAQALAERLASIVEQHPPLENARLHGGMSRRG